MLMTAPLDRHVCVLSSKEFKKFEENVGVTPCNACEGPFKDADEEKAEERAVFEEMERGYYSTVDAEYEAVARARKGL